MKLKPRDWPIWLVILVIVVVFGIGYLLQQVVSEGWGSAINLVRGTVVLVLGVGMADRSMSRGGRP